MKPWRTWLGCLGMLGVLAIIPGCGGGATCPIPAQRARRRPYRRLRRRRHQRRPPRRPHRPPSVAAQDEKTEEAKPEVATAQAEPPAPTEQPGAGGPRCRRRQLAAGPRLRHRGNAGHGDQGSGSSPRPPATPPPAGAPAPGGPGRRPRTAAGMPGPGGAMAMGMQNQQQGQQQAQQQSRQMQANMQANMQNQMRGNAPPGGPGGPGSGPGGGGGNDKPPDFRSPQGAVQAFLDALKARDLDRLTEATALRAQTESSRKYQEMFKTDLRQHALGIGAQWTGDEARGLQDQRREPAPQHRPPRRDPHEAREQQPIQLFHDGHHRPPREEGLGRVRHRRPARVQEPAIWPDEEQEAPVTGRLLVRGRSRGERPST